MGSSPHRSPLYRKALVAVILLACFWGGGTWVVAQGTIAQYGRKTNISKGPRALGLVQLLPNGKARLFPVAIMMDGKFFDAGSYKGKPVPMAVDFDTVYEGFRTGVSQGIFTITQPGQLGHAWIAEGTWLPAGAKPSQKGMKYETPVIEDKDAPPRLHRGTEKPPSENTSQQPPATTPPAAAPPPPPAKTPEPQTASASEDRPIDDPNRPILRRGKPDASVHREPFVNFDELAASASATPASASAAKGSATSVQLIPAISDAGGPDPRPYTFDLKPQEEVSYRGKMLELASQLHARAQAAPQSAPPAAPAARKNAAAAKAPKLAFDDVQLKVFDLSNSNEPVLVLSARTRPSTPAQPGPPTEITLVAKTSLEGELRKLFFSETDAQHLDVAPRLELIDAVDADGDGRGELLFRRISDAGISYAIYRATADQLWPLYEGTP